MFIKSPVLRIKFIGMRFSEHVRLRERVMLGAVGLAGNQSMWAVLVGSILLRHRIAMVILDMRVYDCLIMGS